MPSRTPVKVRQIQPQPIVIHGIYINGNEFGFRTKREAMRAATVWAAPFDTCLGCSSFVKRADGWYIQWDHSSHFHGRD